MRIDEFMRVAAAGRRLQFEILRMWGVFWLIEKIGLGIKEPWNTLYQRTKD